MTRRKLWPLLALIILLFAAVPERAGTEAERGYASAYADGVMDDVIRTRFENDWWPNIPTRDWYMSHGAIAVADSGGWARWRRSSTETGKSIAS